MSRKVVGVEELLAWAYRVELPLVERGSVAGAIERDRQIVRSCGADPFERMRDTGLMVDVSPNRYGVIPDLTAEREPHGDALAVAAAVAAMDGFVVGDLDGVDFLGEPAFDLLNETERRRAHEDGADRAVLPDGRLRSRLSTGLVSAAIIGEFRSADPFEGTITRRVVRRCGMDAWFRVARRVEGEGRAPVEIEVDGFDRVARRPFPGAYRKSELVDRYGETVNLAGIVAERIEWQGWRLALDRLFHELDGALSRFALTPSARPYWPWEGEVGAQEAVERRILPVLKKTGSSEKRAA